MRKKQLFLIAGLVFGLWAPNAAAITFDCPVSLKFEAFSKKTPYTDQYLKKAKFSVIIEKNDNGPSYVSRCGFSQSSNKVTCDKYEVDKIETTILNDRNKSKIIKFYTFYSQFDVQLFSNGSFLENNGRGSIASGKCKIRRL